MGTVRDAALEVLRGHGLTTIFGHPGFTEVAFLTDLPDDFEFVLALHEAAVVGIAIGWATARDQPALVNLHSTSGLGHALGALATARGNRVPLVVLVGQQDRRHLAYQPLRSGDLNGLGGRYPVWVNQPARPQDVPGALARAWHEATTARGPAVVIVPSDDWLEPADDEEIPAPAVLRRADAVGPDVIDELHRLVAGAVSPALVVGADADDADTWSALVALAERLSCPVWQEPLSARAGFPQDHPRFAGHLPPGRQALRASLSGHDVVLVVGAPVFRQYGYEPGPLVEPGTRLALITDEPEDALHSPVGLAVVARLASVCRRLADRLPPRPRSADLPPRLPAVDLTTRLPAADLPPRVPAVDVRTVRREPVEQPSYSEPLRPVHVLTALAERIPADTVIVEEAPSSRAEATRLLPARAPLGYLSAGLGGLGFALPAAVGVRMAQPHRPVVAVVGDGSSLHAVQALWSAAHYVCGVLFVVLANGRYATMDRLAEGGGGKPPWPAFEEASVRSVARGMGCPAQRVDNYPGLLAALDEVVPTLAGRSNPLVLEVAVELD